MTKDRRTRRIKITYVEFPNGATLTRTEGEGFHVDSFDGPLDDHTVEQIHRILAGDAKEPKP
jgi:hypothetical protein